ncbi:CusA/CzcA family heavy metal efflux RND transporter [Flammeovirga sp. EKP202]|uniref:CusA/CzcA family heavy metal efflux RND transporter n=1 Tax=Flammeovirga sp. EKP202 TaxID=2770592 RepID=UPI00165ECCAD|nr:CusA/CzcA family heavy metal efflux RND transporter [Flammeovirga sp. EKP202]MBD0402208.1 CusA/CzcA family heavy metal efflux RND transporter [Flammeovirga sp. EKP202]
MISHIISFSIKNKLVIGVFIIAWICGGIWSLTKVPVDAVPDITNNQVQVITQAPSLGTEEVEQFITYPVELAMSNLPDVEEIRSVSRSGLSLVTIVFNDEVGTYLPRQLVMEKLNEVKESIPKGFGEPFIGPISTGLGEIYQYTLEVDPTFKDHYSLTDLRSIQDWIIRRQMAMVPGVVEVNAFGGYIKQYEVAVEPDVLNSMGITIQDIYTALNQNNQNSGASYIQKDYKANYIKGEGLIRSLDDIRNILVKKEGNIPVRIGDIAKVQFGHAVRYGALTKEGQGEAVGGMILMLKGANSDQVITAVKERVELIQESLPEGVRIKEFLARNKLIENTTSTVSNNLVEGALIVIFILVLLLGNWRGGLVVASTIPLSLLFAFMMMYQFDVWANLMSLGAIDFGIIVDGAVIIVEATVFMMQKKVVSNIGLSQQQKDEVSKEASTKMMNSAFFGQLIILIVFAPILTLEGVEGKMFIPMALTFMFAMIGVMILCLTYVPMISSLFINVKSKNKPSFGGKIIQAIENTYEPILLQSLAKGKMIILACFIVLMASLYIFSTLGGEFMTQLDEGDIAYHVIMKPGTSLEETIKATTKIENIMKSNFPEIEQVMSRIGVADVPTDPMPMDVADCLVILKPKSEWTSASTKEELIDKIKEKVSTVPGINFEFTQPIEMRFNELISGVREDIAIKLYGEDLTVLAEKAEEISALIGDVEGIADKRVEATAGLPQIVVHYDRNKLAQYGLNINELNDLVQTSFTGKSAGVIFEGEKRFDLVVRLEKSKRNDIDDLKSLYVNLPNGHQIPLQQIADVVYETGPMQISRDNTQRRTYVGLMVRGRDIESVVNDIKDKLNQELDLPAGYFIRYGGQFENLERASKKLKIVVPIALLSIFLLLFLALKSLKETLMIAMAIPFATIGGIISLWLRGMPFSISAGVGFVVLFGVAVLNGLVLIEGWNELKHEGVDNLKDRIRIGAKRRIRPILLTALTDILGFLPMAISSSAGAEVQQPLATVVIGGMITSTFLTLIVLPVLYSMIEKSEIVKVNPKPVIAIFVGLILFSLNNESVAQTQRQVINSIDQAISIGLQQNGNMKIANTEIEIAELGKKEALNIQKTQINSTYGQYNSFRNDLGFEVSQNIEFPTVYSKRKDLAKENLIGSQLKLKMTENQIKREIKKAWYQLCYLNEEMELIQFQDSLYKRFLHASNIRFETEATNFLEKASAETQVMDIENKLFLLQSEINIQKNTLRVLLQDTIGLKFKPQKLEKKGGINTRDIESNPTLAFINQQVGVAEAEKKVASAEILPEINLGYFNNSMNGVPLSADGGFANSSNRFQGISVGLAIPIFYGSNKAKIDASKLKAQNAVVQSQQFKIQLEGEQIRLEQEINKLNGSLNYYETKALPQVDRIIENAQKSFEHGAINYIEYFQNINQSLEMKYNYLQTLNTFNQTMIEIEYITGQ